MHRNTYTLVVFLAILAALVSGVNIGKKMSAPQEKETVELISTPTLAQLLPTPKTIKEFTSRGCGVTFPIPDNYMLSDESTLSAMFARTDAKNSFIITCQKDIPRPPLLEGSIDTLKLTNVENTSTISAKLYHDQSPNNGEKIDALIYYNPKIKMDVFIAGYGSEYNSLLQSLRLFP